MKTFSTYISSFCGLLLFVILMSACQPNRYNFVIINRSETILEVEYEYGEPSTKYDDYLLSTPAKIPFEIYDKDDNYKEKWQTLMPDKDFEFETREESVTEKNTTSEETVGSKKQFKKVKLELQPNEVLRVFYSDAINYSPKGVRRLYLQGDKGKLLIEGDSFKQFTEYRPRGFLAQIKDFRLVYGRPEYFE